MAQPVSSADLTSSEITTFVTWWNNTYPSDTTTEATVSGYNGSGQDKIDKRKLIRAMLAVAAMFAAAAGIPFP